MPLVTVPRRSPAEMHDISTERWDALRSTRPDLVPAVDLQQRLLTIVVATGRLLEGKLPRLSLPPRYLDAKLKRGVPILAGEPIPLPVQALQAAFFQLCDALAEGGAGDAALHIKASVAEGQIDAGSLLTASLARHQEAIRQGATHRGLAPDLVWLLAELATSPLAHALQSALLPPAGEWSHGYCPACGSWPALAEFVDGHRVLRCSFCAAAWEMSEYRCTYCGESGGPFKLAAPNEERTDRRLELCLACHGYLKTVDVPSLSPFPFLAIYDMETMELDLAAMEHGYSRPPLREFAKR
jgi:FdhE protein